MNTPYSPRNRAFSDAAHLLAQSSVYPLIFGESALSFEPLPIEQAMTLDADMGIDRHVRVQVEGLHAPFSVLVQERFRRKKFAPYQDITITEWNHNSGLQGEMYKIKAEMFLYGYYDDEFNQFIEAIALAMLPLKQKIAQGLISYTREWSDRSNQTFLCFKFDDLEQQHISIFRKKWGRQVNLCPSMDDLEKGMKKASAPKYRAGNYIPQIDEPIHLSDEDIAVLDYIQYCQSHQQWQEEA